MKYNATVWYQEIHEKVMKFEVDVDIPADSTDEERANLIYNSIESKMHDKFDVMMEEDEALRFMIDDMTFKKVE
mgnify:CR=1 FL=1